MATKLIILFGLLEMCAGINPTLFNYILRGHPFDYYIHNQDSDGGVAIFSYDPKSPNSPPNWERFAPDCGGDAQSPINIIKKKTIKAGKNTDKLEVTKWTDLPEAIKIGNNGHTVYFMFMYADQKEPTILLNGALYELEQLHFHFGLNRKTGSEHYLNDKAYAMEGHAVFFNLIYKTFAKAILHPDGLVVIGRLYEEADTEANININFEFLQNVHNPNQSYIIDESDNYALFSLGDILGPPNIPFYTYHGSLTTPGCNEVVTWCVGAKPIQITSHNIFQFRQLVGLHGLMAPNVRPLQNRNGREVYYHKGGR